MCLVKYIKTFSPLVSFILHASIGAFQLGNPDRSALKSNLESETLLQIKLSRYFFPDIISMKVAFTLRCGPQVHKNLVDDSSYDIY